MTIESGKDRDALGWRTQIDGGLILGIFGSELMIILVYKIVRLCTQVACILVARNIFEESYLHRVHVEKKDPPHLTRMLLLFLSLDATVQLLLTMFAVCIGVVIRADTPANSTFLLDDRLLSLLLAEYVLSTVLIFVVGYIVALSMRQKRYFGYKYQGIGTTQAFAEALMAISAVVMTFPVTMVVHA